MNSLHYANDMQERSIERPLNTNCRTPIDEPCDWTSEPAATVRYGSFSDVNIRQLVGLKSAQT